ncbi:hypothetical protein H072_5923 [Dactylellina haptotyla CBS 200.50]|uniref:AB hydrolase-1 domain-containing protein n=1 Tax=Dactylellina haptotyla (strain CBS 200.50) TaxID=1284197 RepID=S8AGK1_DACHA|nr:hypothetical protein H072_5923 [Dactylellina haptotyla CBS 200.50]
MADILDFQDHCTHAVLKQKTRYQAGERDMVTIFAQFFEDDEKRGRKALNDKQLAQDAFLTLFAGMDTVSHTLTFAIYYTMKHPDVDARLLEEVKNVIQTPTFPAAPEEVLSALPLLQVASTICLSFAKFVLNIEIISNAIQRRHSNFLSPPFTGAPQFSDEGKDGDPESLDSVAKSSVPPFNPHPLLRSGHLQTCASLFTLDDTQFTYKRQIIVAESPDGSDRGSFSIDVAVPFTHGDDDMQNSEPRNIPPRTSFFTPKEFAAWSDEETTPVVVVLHGLGGGSHENYVRLALEPLVSAKTAGGLGFAAVVVNARGCAWTKLTSNKMFNAMFTQDFRQVAALVRERFPKRPIMGLGFSLGANILAHYLGEEGPYCPLKAAVLVSSPHNMEACANLMYMSFTGRQYSKFLASSLKKLFERNYDMLRTNPAIDVEGVRKAVYPFEYDTACTAPVAGFRTGGDQDKAFPLQEVQANPYLVYTTTSIGGHLGWFEWDMGQWFPKPIAGFFGRMEKLKLIDEPSVVNAIDNVEETEEKLSSSWHDSILELFLLALDIPDFGV